MSFMIWKYIVSYFPVEILYLLSLVNKQARKQIVRQYRKIRIINFRINRKIVHDFTEILVLLLLRKFDYRSLLQFNIFNDVLEDIHHLFLSTHVYYLSSQFLIKEIKYTEFLLYQNYIYVLYKYRKYKLMKYLIQNIENTVSINYII